MSDSVDVLDFFIDQLIPHLKSVLGPDYHIEEREPLDTEIQPYQCWIATSSFPQDVRFADSMFRVQISAQVFVTVVYEVSRATNHYRAVRHKRKDVLKAIHRSLILPIEDALIVVGDEDTFLEESFFMSSYPITLSWSEGAL